MLAFDTKSGDCACGGQCDACRGQQPQPPETATSAELARAQWKGYAPAFGSRLESQAERVAQLALEVSDGATHGPTSMLSSLEHVGSAHPPILQRVPVSAGGTGAHAADAASSSTIAAPYGLIVDDTSHPAPGQVSRSTFMDRVSASLLAACNGDLAAVGRTANGCPVLESWLAYYRTQPAAHLERVIRRFGRPITPTTADDLVSAVVGRVRVSIRYWAATGRIAVPEAVAADALAGVAVPMSDANLLQRKVANGHDAGEQIANSPTVIQRKLGAGRPMEGGVRARLERGFGASFSGVVVHTDDTAGRLSRQHSARAFTVGNHIAFNTGEYRPGTLQGDLLIAHELAHTMQQRGAEVMPATSSVNGLLEDDADAAAVGAVGSLLGIGPRHRPRRRFASGARRATHGVCRTRPGSAHSDVPATGNAYRASRRDPRQRWSSSARRTTTAKPTFATRT
jgi:hypothetical protein